MQHRPATANTNYQRTEFNPPKHLGPVLANLARSLTVAEYWAEYDEPIDLLEDPEATFADDAQCLSAICEEHGIAYQRTERGPAFLVWVLMEFYPEDP